MAGSSKSGSGNGNASGKGNGNGNGDGGHHYAPGDIVLGKIKGYPPWPGVLCHEDNVPKRTVLSARPGKNYHIVRFFPAADYGFNRPHELRKLTKREIEAFLSDPHKRAAELREAYKLALDPESWNEEQNEAVRQAEEENDEEEDMLADDDGEEDEEQPIKKRKATSSGGKKSSGNGVSKKQKREEGMHLSTSDAHTSEESKDKKHSSSVRAPSASPHKSATADGEADEAELDPETKKVKGWRYSLQHAFLSRSGQISADELEKHNTTFKQVEEYTHISPTQLRLTKIGKVMKRIVQLGDIPRDEEFHFRQRAQKLCDIWGEVIAGSKSTKMPSASSSTGLTTHPNPAIASDPSTASAKRTAANGTAQLIKAEKGVEGSISSHGAQELDSAEGDLHAADDESGQAAATTSSKAEAREISSDAPIRPAVTAVQTNVADDSVLSQPPEASEQ